MKQRIKAVLRKAASVHEALTAHTDLIEATGRRLAEVLGSGGRVYVMGNGGSAADAQHMAGELVGRFLMERRALPCQALTTDTSVLTAIANDYSVADIFVKQVEAFVGKADAVVGISTSGNSVDVNAALETARRLGATTIGLTGGDGGRMVELCDMCVVVPAEATPRVQEAHGTIIHIWCETVECLLFGDPS